MSDVVKFNTKIVLVGDPGVGKTSMRREYIGQSFQHNYLSTIGADFSVFYTTVNHEDSPIQVSNALWDIAGQEKYQVTYPQYFRGAQAAIIVYNVVQKETFDNVLGWVEKFNEYSNVGRIITLVSNKIDLIESAEENDIVNRNAHDKLIQQLAQRFPKYIYSSYRTSAKNGDNIQSCVNGTVESIVETFQNMPQVKIKQSLKFEDYLIASYITAYDDLTGPAIIKKSPNLGTYSDKEFINSIKVASTIDMDALGAAPNVEGSIPWNDPSGSFHYIAFTDILTKSNKIFIIGFVNAREVNDLIASKYEIISGYFHKAMNEFNILLKSNDKPIEEISATTVEFDDILLNLRINVFKIIEADI